MLQSFSRFRRRSYRVSQRECIAPPSSVIAYRVIWRTWRAVFCTAAFLTCLSCHHPLTAQDNPSTAAGGTQTLNADANSTTDDGQTQNEDRYTKPSSSPWSGKEKQLKAVEKTFGDPPGMVRLDPVSRVWIDKKKKRVVVDGYVALDVGQLEMFACTSGTKEHESVVAVFSKAFIVHAGLLAVGAKTGSPVNWEPEYQPPTGTEIEIFCLWVDEQTGERKNINARKWIREIGTEDQTLDTNFVFAGSRMWKDPDTGQEMYQAEAGDLICVSNFATATLDVPMKSSQVNSGLMFAAFEKRVPPRGTPVRLVLQVVNKSKPAVNENAPAEREARKPTPERGLIDSLKSDNPAAPNQP